MTSPGDDCDRALTGELAALRAALRALRAPADGEVALRAALGARRGSTVTRTARAVRRARVPAALAAAAALGALAMLLLLPAARDDSAVVLDVTPSAPLAAPVAASGERGQAFQPIAFAPALSASQSYSVVRVRIPLAALAPGNMAPPDASIEADLLVGEDGLARAIRFDSAATLVVAARSNQ